MGSSTRQAETLTVYEAPERPRHPHRRIRLCRLYNQQRFRLAARQNHRAFPSRTFPPSCGCAARALKEFLDRRRYHQHRVPARGFLPHPDFAAGKVHTRWVDEHMEALAASSVEPGRSIVDDAAGFAGARVKSRDPLALFAYDARPKTDREAPPERKPDLAGPNGSSGTFPPVSRAPSPSPFRSAMRSGGGSRSRWSRR